jgi:hypothetical protein
MNRSDVLNYISLVLLLVMLGLTLWDIWKPL